MIHFPEPDAMPQRALAEIDQSGIQLKTESPAATIAYAFGIGSAVHGWSDESNSAYFDLASLTKPLFTAPALLRLMTDHRDLDADISELMGWSRSGRSARHLLTHAAGLPAELPPTGSRQEAVDWISEQLRDGGRPNEWITYSDPGYWLLGLLVSELSGEPLHAGFTSVASGGGSGFLFGHAPADRSVPAGPVIAGVRVPHDPAAQRLGPSGHAGAFGTLFGVVSAVVDWLDPAWLPTQFREDARTCQTHATPGGHRSLAWTLAGDPFHVVAHDWPETTLSHSGFTGVSAALDPQSGWWAVHLSNAIPVDRDASPVLKARRRFYGVAAAHLRCCANDNIHL